MKPHFTDAPQKRTTPGSSAPSAAIRPHRNHKARRMTDFTQQQTDSPCVTLIGMAGAGKTTVGLALAKHLGWAHADTDRLIEAHYGRPLQDIFDGFGRDEFIRAEEKLVAGLGLKRCVVSTGGSVVYGKTAIERLHELGRIVHLRVPADTVKQRVADAKGRGLAIAAGQTLDDLYAERLPLYEAAADLTLDCLGKTPEDCAEAIAEWLASEGITA